MDLTRLPKQLALEPKDANVGWLTNHNPRIELYCTFKYELALWPMLAGWLAAVLLAGWVWLSVWAWYLGSAMANSGELSWALAKRRF